MTRAQELLTVYESVLHRIIRFIRGHRETQQTCGHGYRKVGSRCKKMSTQELAHMRKGHRKAARKNRIHQTAIQRRRLRSLLRRSASGY